MDVALPKVLGLAPEILANSKEITDKADTWSAGVLLHTMLSGLCAARALSALGVNMGRFESTPVTVAYYSVGGTFQWRFTHLYYVFGPSHHALRPLYFAAPLVAPVQGRCKRLP